MTCSKTKALFHAYLDGELNPAEQAKLNRHLKACRRCRRELALLMATVDLASQVEVLEPSPAFNQKVLKQIIRPSRIFVRVASVAALWVGAGLILSGFAGARLVSSLDTWLFPLIRKAIPFAKGLFLIGQNFGRGVELSFRGFNPSIVFPALFAVLVVTLLLIKLLTYRTRFGQSRLSRAVNDY